VETPEPISGETWINSLDEIQEYSIIPENDNQTWSLKMFGSEEAFSFSFKYFDAITRKYTWNRTTTEKTWSELNLGDFRN
jgi:hypothetical protein